MSIYDYEELKNKALSRNATQADIDKLGEWFEQYGNSYWNGECYGLGNGSDLYPIYKKTSEDDFEIVGYEIKHF